MNLNNIISFFDNYKFNEKPIRISDAEVITDVKNFVETNIHILKSNSGNKVFSPYYNRLLKLYLKLKK